MGKLSGPEEQNKRDHIQNNKKQQKNNKKTTKNNKQQQKTTTTRKNHNHNMNTTKTSKHQPQSQAKPHRNTPKHPKATRFTCFSEKNGTLAALQKQQRELCKSCFHPQGRCQAPRQLPNFGGFAPIKTLYFNETDPF